MKMFLTDRSELNNAIKKSRENQEKIVLNFLNNHDLYFFHKDFLFGKTFTKNNINLIDGFVLSFYLSVTNLKKVKRLSGPDFIIKFFNNNTDNSKDKKHLFIGFENEDLKKFSGKFPYLNKKNLFAYNPPYIQGTNFPEEEINKIAKIINSKKIDFVWVGLGCPKQNFLSYELIKKTKTRYFFNVGAAMDFILEKKKRAPKIIRNLGIEWFYRLVTDFNHSRKKVWRSFVSLLHLNKVKLKNKKE